MGPPPPPPLLLLLLLTTIFHWLGVHSLPFGVCAHLLLSVCMYVCTYVCMYASDVKDVDGEGEQAWKKGLASFPLDFSLRRPGSWARAKFDWHLSPVTAKDVHDGMQLPGRSECGSTLASFGCVSNPRRKGPLAVSSYPSIYLSTCPIFQHHVSATWS